MTNQDDGASAVAEQALVNQAPAGLGRSGFDPSRWEGVAKNLWDSLVRFSMFEDTLGEIIGDFEKLGHDYYDESLEIYGAGPDVRLGDEAQRLIAAAGFGRVYLNHGKPGDGNRWETHYTFGEGSLPVRGWRRRYVSDATVSSTRVIAGPEDNGYWEISYWPEGWNTPQSLEQRDAGYYRIVPDPFDPFRDTDGSPKGTDPQGLDGEAATAGAGTASHND